MKTFEIKNRAFDYSLNAQIAVKLLGQVQQTAENLFLSPKELHQIILHKKQKNKNQDQYIKNADLNTDPNVVKVEKSGSNKLLIITKSSEKLMSQDNDDDANQNKESQEKDQNSGIETEPSTDEKQEDKDAQNDTVNSNEPSKNEENQDSHNENINEQIDEILSEKKKYFNRRNLFRNLKDLVDKLVSEEKLFQFIQDLIDEIGQNKPEWISCRRVQFATIQNASTEPSFIYNGSKSLSQNNSTSFIVMKMRPGSVGLDSPGSAFMLSITRESNCRLNFGSLIHCDLVSEEKDRIPHPISIETSVELFNDFSEPLIEAYLGDNQSHFKKFCRERWNLFNEGNCLLFKSQDISSFDRKNKEKQTPKHYFSFIPKNEESIELFIEASKFVKPLLPYTPSTILIQNTDLKCIVSIHGVGTDKIDSSAHFFTENNYFAYQMNQRTIKFLIDNIDFLSSVDESISIGMTGESLCYPLGDSNISSKISSKIFYPHCNSSCSSVFSNEFFFYSHLVMLSKVELFDYEEYLLPWISEHSTFDLVDDDLIFHAANGIAREFINVRKAFSRILFTTNSSYLIIKGENPPDSIKKYRYSNGGDQDLMNKFFNTCVNEYIQGDSLIKPVDFTAFFLWNLSR